MANCKFCKKAVRVSPVWHEVCWMNEVQRIAEQVCDTICKFSEAYGDNIDELMDDHCEECVLGQLTGLGL